MFFSTASWKERRKVSDKVVAVQAVRECFLFFVERRRDREREGGERERERERGGSEERERERERERKAAGRRGAKRMLAKRMREEESWLVERGVPW